VNKELDSLQREFGLPYICSSNARHVIETLKGTAGLDASTNAGISKYLRHSETVSAKHYDFSGIATTSRNREKLVALAGQKQTVEIDTESNSTVEPDADISTMTDTQKTKTLFEHVMKDKPVTVMGKLPTADDVRAVIATTFKNADELWKATAPKKVTSRSVFVAKQISRDMYVESRDAYNLIVADRMSGSTKCVH